MAKRVWRYVGPELRKEILRRRASGEDGEQIARAINRAATTVRFVIRAAGGVARRDMFDAPCGRLTLEDRIEIYVGLSEELTWTAIAASIGVATSTVSREIGRNGGRARYRPMAAHRAAERRRRRPKPCKLSDPVLAAVVTEMLEDLLSPQQIAGRLRRDFPDQPEMWVAHETIYKSLYIQGRGELRRELSSCLRTGRARRRAQGRSERHTVPDMVLISDRPGEADDRSVPGHWEGDLIIGKNNKSAIGTLVERSTRFLLLLHLPDRHDALSVRDEMTRVMNTLPEALRRSLTWDRGTEMAEHVQFTVDTGIAVYFCDPSSPWQRGTNENTNGLLRQYFPKGTNLSVHSRADLDRVQDQLNRRPRKTLDFMTPSEALTQLLAPTG